MKGRLWVGELEWEHRWKRRRKGVRRRGRENGKRTEGGWGGEGEATHKFRT